MHDIAVSTQGACSSAKTGQSPVLKAIGLTDDEAYSCIQFSLGRKPYGAPVSILDLLKRSHRHGDYTRTYTSAG